MSRPHPVDTTDVPETDIFSKLLLQAQQRMEQDQDQTVSLARLFSHVRETQRLTHELWEQLDIVNMRNGELQRSLEEHERSHSYYARLYDFAPVGQVITNSEDDILEANLTAAALLGIPRSQLIGQKLAAFVVGETEDQETYARHRRTLAATPEAPTRQTCEVRLKQGETSWFSAHIVSSAAYPLETPSQRYWTVIVDIPEHPDRRNMKHGNDGKAQHESELLRRSESRLRTIIEHSADAIVVDSGGVIRFANPAAEVLFGSPASELLGRELGLPMMVDGKAEVDVPRKGSLPLVVEMRTVEILWEGRRSNLITFRDITAHKQMEEELERCVDERTRMLQHAVHRLLIELIEREQIEGSLRESEEHIRKINTVLEQRIIERTVQLETSNAQLEEMNRSLQHSHDLLHTIINGINDGLLLLDHHGSVLAANRAMTTLLGCRPDELLYQPCQHLCRFCIQDDRARKTVPLFPCQWAIQALYDGYPQQRRERFVRPDGTTRTLDMRALPMVYTREPGGGSPVADKVVLHVVDVTEPLKLEALMIENERLNTARKLAEIVAHEVNTPLQIMISLLDMTQQASEEKRATYLAQVEKEIERIGTILHQLDDTYRPTTEGPSPLDVNSLIQRVLTLTSGRLAKLGIYVEQDLCDPLPHVPGHPDELVQVFLNLVINAIEAMPNGGSLFLRTSVGRESASGRGEYLPAPVVIEIEIADTGTGMPSAVQSHIFEPFFTTKDQGTGLGLFVCQTIIHQHGGTMQVRSQPGEGTTFTIRLPLPELPELPEPHT